jgi:hypothetical protein
VVPSDWLGIAQVVSSLAAAGGLFVAAYQAYRATLVADHSRRVADLQALQKFFVDANERELALSRAPGDTARLYAFNEYLNFLELYAFAYNRDLFGSASKDLVRQKLEDSYNVLDQSKAWHPYIANAIDTSTTLVELKKFVARHREEINQRAAERRRFLSHSDASES